MFPKQSTKQAVSPDVGFFNPQPHIVFSRYVQNEAEVALIWKQLWLQQ